MGVVEEQRKELGAAGWGACLTGVIVLGWVEGVGRSTERPSAGD